MRMILVWDFFNTDPEIRSHRNQTQDLGGDVAPCWGELRRYHMSHDSGLCFPERGAPVLPRVPRLRALPSWEGSSGVVTCPTAPNRSWTIWIKKGLAALGTHLGSRVSKAHSCITKAPAWYAGCYSVSLQCSVGPAGHSWTWLQCDITRHDDTTGCAMFSAAER
jgi:hypothetical protein